MTKKLTILSTYHPAGMMRQRARLTRPFRLHLKKIVAVAAGKKPDRLPNVEINPSARRARAVLRKWRRWAFDIETPMNDHGRVLSIALCGETGLALVWDLRLKSGRTVDTGPLVEAFEGSALKIVQNGAFDVPILETLAKNIQFNIRKFNDQGGCLLWDTLIEQQTRHPDEPASLAFLVSLHQDVRAWKHLRDSTDEELLFYNALDACYTYRHYLHRNDYTEKSDDGSYAASRMEVLPKVIIPLSERGILVNKTVRNRLRAKRKALLMSWKARADRHFEKMGIDSPITTAGNLSSPKILALLYEQLELPVQKSDLTNRPTAGKKALKRLSPRDATGTIELLLERSRLKDAMVPLLSVESPDGRMRSRFVFGGDEKYTDDIGRESPASGRLASRQLNSSHKIGANLQNWTEWVRQILCAPRGSRLIKADYSQIELRIIAYFSKDPNLRKALETDAHLYIMYLLDQETGLYGVANTKWEDLLDRFLGGDDHLRTMRNDCKHNLVYGFTYRMGARKMSSTKDIPYKRAYTALEGLKIVFDRILFWWMDLERTARRHHAETGYAFLENPWGRRRYFDLEDDDFVPKLCNFLPQSVAAEVLLDAMLRIEEALREMRSQMLLTIHDEIVTEAPLEELPQVKELVHQAMEFPVEKMRGMIFPIELTVGQNWAKKSKENPRGQA